MREDRIGRAVTVICVSLTLLAAAPAAATSVGMRAKLNAALKDGRDSTGAPAATAAVIQCGTLLWAGASGVLDLTSGRPATPRALTAIASSTKPMTAALVFDLIQRRKLSLNARLARFYPKLPAARKITIRMLLAHTSGLNEYFDDPHVSETIANHPGHHWTRAEVLRGITKTQFEPGTRYSYSNSGYLVLGGVIEKLTKRPLERAFRKRIADRLGLADSTFTYQPKRSHLFAHPYLRQAGGLKDAFAPGIGVPSDYWGPVWADGGVASTAPDLARFGDGLFRGKLVSAKTVRTMTKLNRFGHAMGVDRQAFDGRVWLGHNGRYGGYESELWHDPNRGVTIAVTTNTNASSLVTWQKLATAYDRLAPRAAPCHDRN